jgi:hypothetical protein
MRGFAVQHEKRSFNADDLSPFQIHVSHPFVNALRSEQSHHRTAIAYTFFGIQSRENCARLMIWHVHTKENSPVQPNWSNRAISNRNARPLSNGLSVESRLVDYAAMGFKAPMSPFSCIHKRRISLLFQSRPRCY